MSGLPPSGDASTYGDRFSNKPTASGDIYTHKGYSAALLPKERWYVVPLGTLVKVTYAGRAVVVKINDRGSGDGTMSRVLDLSRAAYAYLLGRPLEAVTDKNAGLLKDVKIIIVSPGTPLGPVH